MKRGISRQSSLKLRRNLEKLENRFTEIDKMSRLVTRVTRKFTILYVYKNISVSLFLTFDKIIVLFMIVLNIDTYLNIK